MYNATLSLRQLNERLKIINLKLHTDTQVLLSCMDINTIKKILQEGHLSSLYLLFDLSLAAENYIICAAIKQVIAERALKPITSPSTLMAE